MKKYNFNDGVHSNTGIVEGLYLGDSYQLIKAVPDKSVDLIMTDPPYLIDNLNAKSKYVRRFFKRDGSCYVQELSDSSLGKGLDLSILDEFVRVLKDINIYIWCNKAQIFEYLDYFVHKHNCAFDILVWCKLNPMPFINNHYLSDKEFCLYFHSKGLKLNLTYKTGRSFYVSNLNTLDKHLYLHPCIKPLDFVQTLINNACTSGLVFDPFMGSGTTCLASKKLGLRYLGFEIDQKYYNIAVDRLNGIDVHGNMNLLDI